MQTGYYAYETHDDGLRTFDSAEEAINAATGKSEEVGEQITVYSPDGDKIRSVGVSRPNIIKRLRTGAGLTQAALAKEIGGKWNQSRISSLESERRGTPKPKTVMLVAKACGKTVTLLADGWTIDP